MQFRAWFRGLVATCWLMVAIASGQALVVEERPSPTMPRSPWSRLPEEQTYTPVPVELSPEEQINISVYENANRGVVNITTKTESDEGFMLRAVPGKGTGSGA
ncbi:MAG: hypothetical protein AAGF97_08275, partial [Planctomycetota bacterium]